MIFTRRRLADCKNKEGEQIEKTEWHRVKLFGKTAEVAAEYLKKGRQVYIEGRLKYGSYEKDGVKHYTTDILADDMQMIGGNPGGESAGRSAQPARQHAQPAPAGDMQDDDIPF